VKNNPELRIISTNQQSKSNAICFLYINIFPNFRVQLIHIVENNLIRNHIKEMLSKNFDDLIDENRFASIALMYDLFFRIGPKEINDLREAFGNYIKVTKGFFLKRLILFFKDSWSYISHRC